MCWYDPPEVSKKVVKECCERIVYEIKSLEREGDPIGLTINDVKILLDHLYDHKLCTKQ